jgi:CubicO group peptidase (beta-lactamase class C family)
MVRYAIAHLNHGELDGVRILDAATYDEIWKKHGETYFEEPEAHDYGLGWVSGPYQGHRLISHLGLTEGFNAYLALFPEEDTGFVLLVNYAHFDPVDGSKHVIPVLSLARPIFDLLLGIEK